MSMEAFLTGFFKTKAEIISGRKAEGEKYFSEQAERARRIAGTQLAARREKRNQLAQTANTLIHTANMPEHIVRGLVAAGPAALDTALQLFTEVPQHEWSADDWEEIYESSKFYAQEYEEDLPAFLDRTVGLISENYRATEETGGDLKSAFVASALGYNAMDRARSRLEDMEVAPGLSAQAVLDLESRPLHQSAEDSTYAGPMPRAFLDIQKQNQQTAPLTAEDQYKWRGRYEEEVDKEAERLYNQQRENPEFMGTVEDMRDQARINVLPGFVDTVGPQFASQLNFLQPIFSQVETMTQAGQNQQFATDAVSAVQGTPRPSAPTPAEGVDSATSEALRGSQPPQYTAAHDGGGMGIEIAPQTMPESQGPNAFQRGWEALKGIFSGGGISDRGTTGTEGLSATGVDTSGIRERASGIGRAASQAFRGAGGMSDNQGMILMGVDTETREQVFKVPATGQEVRVPLGQ